MPEPRAWAEDGWTAVVTPTGAVAYVLGQCVPRGHHLVGYCDGGIRQAQQLVAARIGESLEQLARGRSG